MLNCHINRSVFLFSQYVFREGQVRRINALLSTHPNLLVPHGIEVIACALSECTYMLYSAICTAAESWQSRSITLLLPEEQLYKGLLHPARLPFPLMCYTQQGYPSPSCTIPSKTTLPPHVLYPAHWRIQRGG